MLAPWGPSSISAVAELVFILSGNVTMCAENKTTMNIETQKIQRKDTKIEHYNKTGEQRLDKRHISGDFPSIRVAGNPSKNCDRISPI